MFVPHAAACSERHPVGGAPHPNGSPGAESAPKGPGAGASARRPGSGELGARLANGLRHVWGPEGKSQRICRLKRIAAEVQLVEHSLLDNKRLSYVGLSTCKSPLCPLCAPKWQRTRADEITQAIDHWESRGAGRGRFVTFTMRHHPGMALALQHRLLTSAFGHLWAGRRGQLLKHELGGKPESVRAHDRTWSFERSWHPHLHCLLFLQSVQYGNEELRELLATRWNEALGEALRRMKRFCVRVIARAAQLAELCFEERIGFSCLLGTEDFKAMQQEALRADRDLPLCPCLACARKRLKTRRCPCSVCQLTRARRIFGARLCPKNQPVLESAKRMRTLLEAFTEANLRPNDRGVDLSVIRASDRAPEYLAKLGLELGWTESKGVNEVEGVKHYPYWAVAHLSTIHGHKLRVPARRAWAELFRATRATQTITFSDRDALGLGPDPYAEGEEPPEAAEGELTRVLGSIAGGQWDQLAKEQKHGVLVTLAVAHEKNLIGELPYVMPPPTWASGIPAVRGPPPKPGRLSPHERLVRLADYERRGEALSQRMAAAMPAPVPEEPMEPFRFDTVAPKGSPRSVQEIRERIDRSKQLRLRFQIDW